MEWYYVLLIVIWAIPVGVLLVAMAFVEADGNFLKGLPASLLWPLWVIPIALYEIGGAIIRRKP